RAHRSAAAVARRALRSDAQERPRQAGRAAVALPRDLVAAVGDDVDARALHAAARLVVPLERERTARPEREDVRALRLELLVRHLDHADPALVEQPHEARRGDA